MILLLVCLLGVQELPLQGLDVRSQAIALLVELIFLFLVLADERVNLLVFDLQDAL